MTRHYFLFDVYCTVRFTIWRSIAHHQHLLWVPRTNTLACSRGVFSLIFRGNYKRRITGYRKIVLLLLGTWWTYATFSTLWLESIEINMTFSWRVHLSHLLLKDECEGSFGIVILNVFYVISTPSCTWSAVTLFLLIWILEMKAKSWWNGECCFKDNRSNGG